MLLTIIAAIAFLVLANVTINQKESLKKVLFGALSFASLYVASLSFIILLGVTG
ncbi:hypothetical protein ACR56S_04385 [Staphylococcus hominis]|uniref:hypothetical protein n=1 Tax=Staphylococcus hominis TaxID=1290 RepID=UPI003DA1C380